MKVVLAIALVLVLVIGVYVGTYAAIVSPYSGVGCGPDGSTAYHYRYNGAYYNWIATVFWPIEQADRKFRPHAWGYPDEPNVELQTEISPQP